MVTELDNLNVAAWKSKARVEIKVGLLLDAEQSLKRALALDPSD